YRVAQHTLRPFPTRRSSDLRGRVLPPSYSPTWGDFALVPRFRDARLLGGTESLREEREDDKVNAMQHRIGHECALCDAHSKAARSEEHTSELQSLRQLVCRQ